MRSTLCGACDGPMEYRRGPGSLVTEVPPTHCRHGHELRPARMTLGFEHGTPAHREYRCWVCMGEGRPDPVTRREIPPPAEARPFPT